MPNINTLIAMADVGRLGVGLPVQGTAGIVRNFSGIVCAPAVKIDRPKRLDIWLMLLTVGGVPSIALSKPILVAERVSVQASLSAENGVLRYSLNSRGQGFRKAKLELVRKIHTGMSMTHGLGRVTATEKPPI